MVKNYIKRAIKKQVMKKILCILFVISLLLFLGSCSEKQEVPTEQQQIMEEQQPTEEVTAEETPVDYTISDFTPPTGKAEGPDDDNPWNSRMLFATSEEGITWTKTNQLIADQANVPSAVVKDGRIFAYHVTWFEPLRNSVVVAISEDNGETWVFKKVIVEGIEGGMRPATDPCVVLLEDGTFRLYFTSEKPGVGHPEVFSAISVDGINFILEDGVRFSITEAGDKVIDPTVLKIGDTWHLYTLYLGGSQGNFHATSKDGLTFTEQDTIKENMILSNGITMDGVSRFYGFKHTADKDSKYAFEIDSWTSEDGFTWIMDEGVRLVYDKENKMEKNFVKDPAVVQLEDGTYMMFYITAIPDE